MHRTYKPEYRISNSDNMEYRSSEIKAGMFIFISFLALVFFVFIIGDLQNYFRSKKQLQIIFNFADGLNVGAPVRYAGLDIGRVKNIKLLDSGVGSGKDRISALVDINPNVHIKKDSSAVIKTAGLMGGLYIDIRPGSEKSPRLKNNEPLIGQDSFEFTKIGDMLGEFVHQIKRISDVADDLAETVKTTMKMFQESMDSVNQLIAGNQQNVQSTVKNLSQITRELSDLLNENKDEFHESLVNFASFTKQADNILKEKTDTISRILTQIDNAAMEMESLLVENRPVVTSVIRNLEAGTKKITGSIESIGKNLEGTINHGNSVLMENRRNLMQLISNLKIISVNLKELSDDLKRNPWKLIRKTDDKLVPVEENAHQEKPEGELRMKRLDKISSE